MDDTTARMAPTLSSDVALANAQDARANLRIAFDVAYGIIGVMTVMAVISVFLAYKVYRAYGWQIFQEQGASLLKKRLLRRVHLFILFLKLNLYFSFGIFVQFCVASVLNHVTKDNGEHMFSTYAKKWLPGVIILGIIGMLYYFCGWYAIEYANRPAMVGFFICILANLGAVLFVLIASSPHGFLEADLLVTTIWLKSFIAVQIFLNVCTLINAIMCWRGFDTGLGDIVSSRRRKEDVEMSTAAEPRPRIELD
ncbi:hypothetical protein HKX48_007776 [Thoreauomyces humboldtii]|nr:hypothetical protein HKX48_007776 [Thoreauomyces humboldtii]